MLNLKNQNNIFGSFFYFEEISSEEVNYKIVK
jgi:hypothetical protein